MQLITLGAFRPYSITSIYMAWLSVGDAGDGRKAIGLIERLIPKNIAVAPSNWVRGGRQTHPHHECVPLNSDCVLSSTIDSRCCCCCCCGGGGAIFQSPDEVPQCPTERCVHRKRGDEICKRLSNVHANVAIDNGTQMVLSRYNTQSFIHQ